MTSTRTMSWPAALALGTLLMHPAHADGPLLVDPKTQTGYHFGPDPVPVYYDLGNFADFVDYSTGTPTKVVFPNSVGAHLVEKGYADWSAVPTTSLRAQVKGNFSLKGLPNINASNVSRIIGTSNGRGIYVIFDADGSIMRDYLGVPDGVLGVSMPQYVMQGTTIITESWTILNGAAVNPQDTDAAAFQGVATHEFGHSLGLAHAQVNGAAVFFGDAPGPHSCASLPYSAAVTSADIETMYPYIDPTPGTGTGVAQGNIHTLDSMAGISDLYPGPGWPRDYGSIEGVVYDVDGKSPLTGVNVIARNIEDPYAGATSAVSGQLTQGLLGPDGRFVLHGLKPGQRYVLYVDAILAGGFPTPPLWFLPGAERFYSDDPRISDPCHFGLIAAQAGATVRAPIKFALVPGAPRLYQLGYGTGVTGISGNGEIAVGDYGRGGPVFQWTAKTGIVPMNAISTGEIDSISPNGKYLSANLLDVNNDTSLGAYRWDAVSGWQAVAPLGNCGTDRSANMAVDNNGSVYGLMYRSCTAYYGFRWNPAGGSVLLPSPGVKPDGKPVNTRVNKVSADGQTIVGWQEDPLYGIWEGVVWNSDVPTLVRTPKGELVDEVTAVSADGSTIGGALFDGEYPLGDGYRRPARGTRMEWISPLPGDASPATPNAMSSNGAVMVGFSGNPFLSLNPGPFIWTRELGTVNLDDFVRRQGTAMEQLFSLWEPTALSGDGRSIGGWGSALLGPAGWVLKINTVFICHRSSASPAGKSVPPGETLSVAFPEEFDQHLAQGDTVGGC